MPHRNSTDTPTDAQIRAAIDRGETGEKVDWPDPAAVPMGVDAEAGGTATPQTARRADRTDSHPAVQTPARGSVASVATYVAIALVILAVVIAIVFVA